MEKNRMIISTPRRLGQTQQQKDRIEIEKALGNKVVVINADSKPEKPMIAKGLVDFIRAFFPMYH